jgi:hypothetical protein
MRGESEKQLGWLSVINLEARVRKDHPLRRIKPWADRALGELSPVVPWASGPASCRHLE